MNVEFYYDFGSPTSYLAHGRLLQLKEKYGCDIDYRPMLLGGIFKETNNLPPAAVPAKGVYMNKFDLPRFAKRYGMPLTFNPHFPINTLTLMRGVFVAREMDCELAYMNAVFEPFWTAEKNMGDLEVLAGVLDSAGLDARALLEGTQQPEIKDALIAATAEAAGRGVFGAPTFFIGEEMFFGQDRLDFIEEHLAAAHSD